MSFYAGRTAGCTRKGRKFGSPLSETWMKGGFTSALQAVKNIYRQAKNNGSSREWEQDSEIQAIHCHEA